MWWHNEINYYQLIPNVEVDISIRPKEFQKLNDPNKCLSDSKLSKNYNDCYRNHVQESIHSAKMGEKFCEDNEFGNCTIPHVGKIQTLQKHFVRKHIYFTSSWISLVHWKMKAMQYAQRVNMLFVLKPLFLDLQER